MARLGGGPKGVDLTLRFRDDRKKVSYVHALRLVKAELILFSYRVGFLVLGVECLDHGATYFDQMNVVALAADDRAAVPRLRDARAGERGGALRRAAAGGLPAGRVRRRPRPVASWRWCRPAPCCP